MTSPNLLSHARQLLRRIPGATALARRWRQLSASAKPASLRRFPLVAADPPHEHSYRLRGNFYHRDALQNPSQLPRHIPSAANLRPSPPIAAESISVPSLFVIGAARSGTTILKSCLNRSPDILLLAEADFWQNPDVPDYAQWFNHKHDQMGSAPSKGNYLPLPQLPEFGPLGLLERLAKSHRYVGEKLALGPHYYQADWPRTCFDYHAQHFYNGRYVLILRHPVESMWSMSKMFRDRTAARSVLAWIESVILQLDFYSVFPHTRVIFFDRLSTDTLDRLRRWLHVRLPIQGEWLSAERVNTRVEGDALPPVLDPYEPICRRATSVYVTLRDTFCPRRLRLPAIIPPMGILGKMRRELASLAELAHLEIERAESSPAESSAKTARRAA